MDTISALLPEKPPLGAWYLVTPGGLSSVKITDGLTFAEEETHQGRQLALVPPRGEEGLIRFRVDASGIWLAVCHNEWQISGVEGVVVRPFPIFRPVDVFFRDSVVHLRPDFSSVECEQTIQLSLEPVPEESQPLLSLTSIRRLQHQVNDSQENIALVAEDKSSADPLAVISPLPEPGLKKIAGQGRPSSIRLIPDPAPQGEIPLLTDTVAPGGRLIPSISLVSNRLESERSPAKEVIVKELHENPRNVEACAGDRTEAEAKVIDASADRESTDQPDRGDEAVPKRRVLARLGAFAIGLFMVSTDLPRLVTPEAFTEEETPLVHPVDPSEVEQIEPTGRPDTSPELMAAVQALLESKSPTDPVTRQFVEDAIRAVNEGEDVPEGRTLPATPGTANPGSDSSVTEPVGNAARGRE
jgi:hypothetical protein